MFTRQDINYAMIHILMFFIGYSGGMAAMRHANPNFTSNFDWQALNAGLIAMGGSTIGISMVGKSQTTVAQEQQDRQANLTKEILSQITPIAPTVVEPKEEIKHDG